jgi:predicted HicB family RNase H-like nuclease
MVHVRLEPELHRKLRLVVAAEDTTLQEWIARTLAAAADKAWPAITQGGVR